MLLIALAVGVVTVAGLAIHGPVGGVLLLLVAAMLVLLASGTWGRVQRDGRAVRLGIIALVLLLAVLKLAGRT
jgi:hypothetical protein